MNLQIQILHIFITLISIAGIPASRPPGLQAKGVFLL